MATRSAFLDDSYQMYRMDNVLDSVNLNVIGWNRATVADGQWLQDNAIGPLSARDMYLADCIDEAWGSINDIRQTLADMGAETTGVNLVGFTMKSLNVAQCNDPEAAYLPGNLSWASKETPLVTSGAGDTFITPASLSFLTFGNQAKHIGEEVAGTLAASEIGGILQMNTTAHDAYQMAFTPSGIYYRHISNSDGTPQIQTGERGNFTYMSNPAAFSALPLGAMTEAQINTKLQGYQTVAGMNNYYTSGQTSGKDQLSTEFAKYYTTAQTSGKDQLSTEFGKYYTTANTSGKDQLSTEFAKYYTTAQTSSTTQLDTAFGACLTAVSAKDSIFSGDGTTAHPLNASIGADGYYAFWKDGNSISLTEIENTIIQLTSAGTNRQDTLSAWLQLIINEIAALKPQQQQPTES